MDNDGAYGYWQWIEIHFKTIAKAIKLDMISNGGDKIASALLNECLWHFIL